MVSGDSVVCSVCGIGLREGWAIEPQIHHSSAKNISSSSLQPCGCGSAPLAHSAAQSASVVTRQQLLVSRVQSLSQSTIDTIDKGRVSQSVLSCAVQLRPLESRAHDSVLQCVHTTQYLEYYYEL